MAYETLQKAVIYCRVSSAKQVSDGHGLSSQETRCREYARHKNYDVVCAFHDEGLSGKLLERPQLREMLTYLAKHKKDNPVVIIDDISRLARDIETHIRLRTAISAVNGKLESPSIEFGEDSDSRLVEHLLASVAAHQREKNAEQVKNRMRARAMNGYWVANSPFGYRYDKVSGHGKLLVRDEPLFSILQEALESFASGKFETQSEVKAFLDASAAFPKSQNGEVRFQQVFDILHRPLYAGRITLPNWGLYNVEGKHEPMISFETFQKIQERLNAKAKAPARKDLDEDFPLRGAVGCGGCGEPLTSCWSKGRNQHYGYYLCHRKACSEYGKSIKKEKMESEFEGLLKELRPSETLFEMAKAMFRDLWENRAQKGKAEILVIEADLRKAEKDIAQLLDRIVETDNRQVVGAYEKRITALEESKIVLREKMAKCGQALPDFDKTFRTAFEFLSNPHGLWASGKIGNRRTALKLCFAERLHYDRKEGFRTVSTSLPYGVLRGMKRGQSIMVGRGDLNC